MFDDSKRAPIRLLGQGPFGVYPAVHKPLANVVKVGKDCANDTSIIRGGFLGNACITAEGKPFWPSEDRFLIDIDENPP